MIPIKKTIVVLAGGLGSRYKALKQIDGILNNQSPLLEYSIYDAIKAGFNKVVFIINPSIPKDFINRLSDILNKKGIENHWIIQNIPDFVLNPSLLKNRIKPWGTAHALLCAKNVVKEPFIVINADDYYGITSYKTAATWIDLGKITEHSYSMVAYILKNTLSKNGSVARGLVTHNATNYLEEVRELTKIIEENKLIVYEEENIKYPLDANDFVSMNFWILHPSIFNYLEIGFNNFLETNPDEKTEYFLPVVIDNLVKNHIVNVYVNHSEEIWKGVTYFADKTDVQNFLEQKTLVNIYPNDLWI